MKRQWKKRRWPVYFHSEHSEAYKKVLEPIIDQVDFAIDHTTENAESQYEWMNEQFIVIFFWVILQFENINIVK